MRWFALIAVCVLATAGCKKKPKPAEPDPAAQQPASGGGGDGIIAAGGGFGVVNPQAALGGGGGGGAVMAVRKAVERVKDGLNEMNTLGQVIQLMLTDEGRMPTRERIVAELKQYPRLLTYVSEGKIILTGTTEAGGLWAFEPEADKSPSIALIGGRATRTNPDELRPYLLALPPALLQPPAPKGAIDNQPAPPQPAAPAANVTRQDLEEIRIYLDNASGASGQMPTPQQTLAALKQAASPQTVNLVQKGAITLVPTRAREGIWAYETAALQRGGLVTGSNGTETLTAAELRRRLGR